MNRVPNKIMSTVLNNRFKRKYFSPAKVDKLNTHCNLIQLLVWWDKLSIQYKNKQFSLAEDDHCVIYPDMMVNHYTGLSLNPINTLMHYYEMSFPQACYVANYFLTKVSKLEMQNYIAETYTSPLVTTEDNGIDLDYILVSDQTHSETPEIKSAALRRIYAYLCNTRHIDRDLVSHFIKKRYIAMDATQNICFLTYRGESVFAITKKGTDPRHPFKQNIVRERHTGFFYGSSTVKDFKSVYVFESCVDLMSFLTLAKQGDIQDLDMESCFISLNGASRKYLDKVLAERPSIERLHLCLDNDKVGRAAAGDVLYSVHSRPLSKDTLVGLLEKAQVKDWNELLAKKMDDEAHLPF